MTDAAVISALVVVALVAGCDLLLSLALARRVRLLQGLGRPTRNSDPELIGEVVSPFETTALDGHLVNDDRFSQGSTLVAFLAAGCEPCVRLKREILASPPREPFVLFASGRDDGGMPAFVSELAEVAQEAVWTEDGSLVSQAFRIRAFPTVLRVVNGVIVAAGLSFEDVRVAADAA